MGNFTFLTLIPLISAICYFILLIILLGSRNNKLARSYIYYIIAMIIWSLGSFLMKIDLTQSLFWNKILCVGMISVPALFYHFTLVLTGITNRKQVRNLGYLITVGLLVGNFLGLITTDAYMINDRFYYEIGPFAPFLAIYSVCYSVLALTNILKKVNANEIPYRRVKWIILGIILMFLGGLLNLIPSIGQYPFDIIINTFNAIFIVYSIYRYKFLEIKYIIKRGLTYSLYTLILSSIYIIAIIGFQQLVIKKIGYDGITPTLIVALILALLFQPFIKYIQDFIDKLFYCETLNHKKTLKDFSQVINYILNLNELSEALIDTINSSIQPKAVYLLLEQENDNFYFYNEMKLLNHIKKIQLKSDNPIIKWFKKGETLLTLGKIENSPTFSSLWGEEKQLLLNLKTELLIPIRHREKISGLLILTEKHSSEAYSSDEIDLIHTLVNNAAVVIENAKMYEIAKQQAITDGLTKLYNHRYFHEVLNEIINNNRYEVFSVAMLDIDLFKFYNDLYGHSAGDQALIKISDVLIENTNEKDIVVRYGGEEFAIIFPDIQGQNSYKAIEKIRKAVENNFNRVGTFSEFITISAGVASYPQDGKTVETILEHADQAMYAAKQSGRNKAILYTKIDEDINKTDEHLNIHELQNSIKSAYLSSIYALAATIDAKDRYTFGHSENVSNLAVLLAESAGFNEKQIAIVKNAGLLHDVGKIGIPETILTKIEKLTDDEYEIMKNHVDISITIIKHVPNLIEVIPAIMCHHERYDGLGYPRGIKGEHIPIEGRCLCIVDAFDAMMTDRPYRKALKIEQVMSELKENKGKQFDPILVDMFISLIEDRQLEELSIDNRY